MKLNDFKGKNFAEGEKVPLWIWSPVEFKAIKMEFKVNGYRLVYDDYFSERIESVGFHSVFETKEEVILDEIQRRLDYIDSMNYEIQEIQKIAREGD